MASPSQANPALPDGVAPSDWGQIQSLIAAQRHEFQATLAGHVTSNPGLRATARFDGNSGVIEIDSSDKRFGLALKSYGFAGSAISVDVPTFGACADGQELTYDWSDELSEWWLNDSRGFEHGFNVWKRPANATGAVTNESLVNIPSPARRRHELKRAALDADSGTEPELAPLNLACRRYCAEEWRE